MRNQTIVLLLIAAMLVVGAVLYFRRDQKKGSNPNDTVCCKATMLTEKGIVQKSKTSTREECEEKRSKLAQELQETREGIEADKELKPEEKAITQNVINLMKVEMTDGSC